MGKVRKANDKEIQSALKQIGDIKDSMDQLNLENVIESILSNIFEVIGEFLMRS